MIEIKKRFLLKGILFFSLITLSVAYFIEHVLGHLPCSLCLMQRVPYILAIIFIALIFFSNRFEKPVLFLLSVVFIFYWWSNPNVTGMLMHAERPKPHPRLAHQFRLAVDCSPSLQQQRLFSFHWLSIAEATTSIAQGTEVAVL